MTFFLILRSINFVFSKSFSISEQVFSSLKTAVIHVSPKTKTTGRGLNSLTNQKEQLDLYGFDCSFLMSSQSKNKQYLMILTYQERLENGIAQT